MPDEPDPDVLRRFAQGDLAAFEALFRRFEGDVFRWTVRILRDESAAEDVLVDAFWRAYRSRARFDPSRSFGAWIRRIATNAARDHLRDARTRRTWVPVVDDTLAALPAVDLHVRDAVARAFRALSPKLRIVATLALVDDRPHAEIADALGVPVSTIKSRLFRAVRVLRRELARLGVQR